MKLPQLVLLLFLLASAPLVNAKTFSYKHFSVEDGLPSTRVYSCVQDDLGYMWFATAMGAVRFDGNVFEKFSVKNGLQENNTIITQKDTKGRVWFASLSGFLSYFENGEIHQYEFNKKLQEIWDFEGDGIKNLIFPDSSHMLIVSYNNGYILVDDEGNTSRSNQETYSSIININGTCISFRDSEKEDNGRISLGHFPGSNFPESIHSPEVAESISFSCYDSLHKTLYFSCGKHLFKLKGNNCKKIFTGETDIWDIKYIHNRLWVGFSNDGYSVLNIEDKVHVDLSDLRELSVRTIYKDKEGSLWILTYQDGIYFLPNPDHYTYTIKDGLASNILSIMVGNSEKIVFADPTGPVGQVYLETGEVISMRKFGKNEHYYLIYHKFDDNFIIIRRALTSKIIGNEEIKSEPHLYGVMAPLDTNRTVSFTNDGDSLLIIEKWNEIIREYRIQINPKLHFHDLRCAYRGKNEIFLGTDDGLFSFPVVNSEISTVYSYWGDTNSLYQNRIINITSSDQYDLVLGTEENGLVIIQGDQILHIKEENGLLHDAVTGLYVDSSNTIWTGTPEGLSVIDTNFNIINIRMEDGLISNQINSVFVTKEKAYVGTNKGLTVLDKNRLKKDSIDIPILLKSITLENNEKITPNGNTINVDYNLPVLKINFVGISYKSMGRIEYRYRLNETENWQYTKGTELLFNNMGSGEYRLEIQATNGENPWSSEPGILYINVAYPFWRTWTFIIISGLLFIGIAILLFRFALRRVQRRADLKEQIQTLRFEALNAQMNPHFMFNSLNSIQNFIMQNEKKASVRYLSKFAKLMRLTLNHSQRKHIFLEEELKSLELYLTLEMLRFDQQFDYELVIDSDVDQQNTLIPALLIQPIVENAILHGIRPLESGGHIEIRLTQESNQLTIKVEDNGVGRNLKKMNEQEKKADGHQSKGSLMTEERIALFAKEFKGAYDYKIIDLKNNEVSSGTKVILTIPHILNTTKK